MKQKVYKIEPDGAAKDKMAEFQELCRKAGLKVTPQRLEIYKELINTKEHPSADMLWQKVRKTFPSISLDTVNRTLLTLSKIGAAFVVEGSGDVKRFDGGMTVHQHFRCTQCRRIIDFHHKPFDSIAVPPELEQGFLIVRKTVYLEGICRYCQKKDVYH
jgi:Fur family transcriptional regulator, peroxide stress response regulator